MGPDGGTRESEHFSHEGGEVAGVGPEAPDDESGGEGVSAVAGSYEAAPPPSEVENVNKAELIEQMIERDIRAAISDLPREADKERIAEAIRSHYAYEFKYRGFGNNGISSVHAAKK